MTSGLSELPVTQCESPAAKEVSGCNLGSATDSERQRLGHAYLQLCSCKEGEEPGWHHPTPIRTMISCHVRTGWHWKEPPSFDRDGETLVNVVLSVLLLLLWFLTLRYIVFIAKGKIIHAAGSWSNSCLRISIFDHKIRSNRCFKSHLKLLLYYGTGHSLS